MVWNTKDFTILQSPQELWSPQLYLVGEKLRILNKPTNFTVTATTESLSKSDRVKKCGKQSIVSNDANHGHTPPPSASIHTSEPIQYDSGTGSDIWGASDTT